MKASELRIGNLLEFSNGIQPTKTVTVGRRFFSSASIEKEDGDFEITGYYKPIALNEIWLQKLGFKKKGSEWKLFPCAEVQIIVFNENDYNGVMFYTRTIHTDYTPIYCGSQINYVHQLQNLYYALTSVELSVS
jgi:hypothetical protein